MRTFILCAATGGLALGALAAYLPVEARQERIWFHTSYTPAYQVPSFKAPTVKVAKKALPKPKLDIAEMQVETTQDLIEPAEHEEARAAAIRYALAHSSGESEKASLMRP